eukprot:3016946-Rhodomonas_salina.1
MCVCGTDAGYAATRMCYGMRIGQDGTGQRECGTDAGYAATRWYRGTDAGYAAMRMCYGMRIGQDGTGNGDEGAPTGRFETVIGPFT